MSDTVRGSNKNRNIIIAAAAFLLVLVAICGGVFAWSHTDSGRKSTEALQGQFTDVERPDKSDMLTEVPTPPVNKADGDDDPYLGVDMYGRKMDIPKSLTVAPKNGKPVVVPKPNAEDMRQVSNIGMIFNAPSVGINNLPIGAVDEVTLAGGTTLIEPTNFVNMFTVRNRGVGENINQSTVQRGTLYLAVHATDLGTLAPGNFLVDRDTRSNRLQEGDIVEVIGKDKKPVRYKITAARRDGKDLVSNDQEVWDNKPGRVVIITCFPNSVDNFVFIG